MTFELPKEAAESEASVKLIGDFNDWNPAVPPMSQLKNGKFTSKLELDAGREYQFRYLINDNVWENDWNADKYVPNPYGDGDNSVVIV